MEDMSYQTVDVSPSRHKKATCELKQGQKMKEDQRVQDHLVSWYF